MKEMDEEARKIVDALRCCNEIPHDCTKKGCYLASSKRICVMALRDDSADLIERLSEELEQVKRERDAAVRDARLGGHCKKCIFEDGSPECEGCCFGFGNNDNWQWRGVCEENSGGGKE